MEIRIKESVTAGEWSVEYRLQVSDALLTSAASPDESCSVRTKITTYTE